MPPFQVRSRPPVVRLVNAFERPFENAVATARTCYSAGGPVTPAQVSGDGLDDARREKRALARDRLARSIYRAGHHTTFQHPHFQFTLENVSRQFLWTFLHAHPFYNSEQVSQRYVAVKPEEATIPDLGGEAQAVYEEALRAQGEAYHRLDAMLKPVAAELFYGRFPGKRKNRERHDADVAKRTQEVARYVLPLATFAYLYHTVSALTLFRYRRVMEQLDAPAETRAVVEAMAQAALALDPLLDRVLEDPVPLEETPEWRHFVAFAPARASGEAARFRERFDASLEGRVSKLVDWKPAAEVVLAESVRETLGLTPERLSDDEAIRAVLDPARLSWFGEALNVGEHSKLARALHHPHYTFRKRLSHTADSQDQRHRMTPGSRPILLAHLDDRPDYETPEMVRLDPAAQALYDETMRRSYDAARRLRALGVSDEWAAYVLPNATRVRFTESGDLMALHHKFAMRLCYNAQEEIWR
ncbi:MAG TPA: FAD-dependent thymidylate synthase, partial [Planctomycetota bacterium]|nr:FAD-dependent thymidylate synthase [Planctomycetota bacterium]